MNHWDDIHSQLLAEVDGLAYAVVTRLQAELPGYASVSPESLLPGVAGNIRRCLLAVRDRRSVEDTHLEAAGAVGAVRARQHISVEEVLRGFRVAVQELWSREVSLARTIGADDSMLLSAAQATWEWADAAAARAAQVHRQVEIDLVHHDSQQRADLLRAILLGTISVHELDSVAPLHGLATDQTYLPFRARPRSGHSTQQVEQALRRAGRTSAVDNLVTILDNDLAGLLTRRPELGDVAVLGLGPPSPLHRVEPAFALAGDLLNAAEAFGLTGVYDLEDLGPRLAVYRQRDISAHLGQRYLQPLQELGDFGHELIRTLTEYLRHGLHVDSAARALFVHPNTLRHRLLRVEQIVSVNLDEVDDLVRLWWALQHQLVTLAQPGSDVAADTAAQHRRRH